MGLQEVAVAESPEHADAGQTGIAGGEDVDIAITNINSFFFCNTQLAQGFQHGVGSRFATNSLCLMLTDGHLNAVGKEMAAQLLRGIIKLIAHHSRATASAAQFAEHLRDAIVWTCSVERMFQIILAEGGENIFKLRVDLTIWHGPLYQHTHSITHKAAHGIDAMLRHPVGTQGIVHSTG